MIEPGRPVKDIEINPDTPILKIFEELSQSGGFESVNLSDGLEILAEMIPQENCLKFLSFVAAVMSTGLRGIIKDMIKNGWFDVVMTTCGALDHDIARHFSHYREGSFTMDDRGAGRTGHAQTRKHPDPHEQLRATHRRKDAGVS